ncbi:hypothetical protein [Bordetella sp. BOR01]|uniref:hypothetical protein n=1 Tax=Bordetella sp. BOR01 TaxID=2854779 RepID=UPI001C481F65|nr:hypothetical protein [Bordetella sp. BOR01]MBV7481671.1 hypothetical protein [Bordetella sp. BOR01]
MRHALWFACLACVAGAALRPDTAWASGPWAAPVGFSGPVPACSQDDYRDAQFASSFPAIEPAEKSFVLAGDEPLECRQRGASEFASFIARTGTASDDKFREYWLATRLVPSYPDVGNSALLPLWQWIEFAR